MAGTLTLPWSAKMPTVLGKRVLRKFLHRRYVARLPVLLSILWSNVCNYILRSAQRRRRSSRMVFGNSTVTSNAMVTTAVPIGPTIFTRMHTTTCDGGELLAAQA